MTPHANYHKMSISKLCLIMQVLIGIPYEGFGLNVSEVSVSQPEPIKEVIRIINHFSLKKQKYYMDWCLIMRLPLRWVIRCLNRTSNFMARCCLELRNLSHDGKGL